MATQANVQTSEPASDLTQKFNEVRALYADAPELGKTALANLLANLKSEVATRAEATRTQSASRVGSRQGNVSEFTLFFPFAKGGAKRLRGLLKLLDGTFQGADKVGTVHDMRFVFLDNDTKLLFATAYDGEWDAYIEDFATKIPDYMDMLFCSLKGFPGIRSPSVKDWVAKHQIPAEGWYVANPNLTVVQTRRLERVGKALDEFLDKIG